MPRVASVSGTCRLTKSEHASSSSSGIRLIPWRWSKSASTIVSKATTSHLERRAPKGHGPADTAHADQSQGHARAPAVPGRGPSRRCGSRDRCETMRRGMASRSAQVCSATLSWLVPGVIVTATRCAEAAGHVDQVVTDPGPGDHAQFAGPARRDRATSALPRRSRRRYSREKGSSCSLVKEKSPCGSTTSNPASSKISRKRPGCASEEIRADQNSGHGHLGVINGYDRRDMCSWTTDGADFFGPGPPSPCVGPVAQLILIEPGGQPCFAAAHWRARFTGG